MSTGERGSANILRWMEYGQISSLTTNPDTKTNLRRRQISDSTTNLRLNEKSKTWVGISDSATKLRLWRISDSMMNLRLDDESQTRQQISDSMKNLKLIDKSQTCRQIFYCNISPLGDKMVTNLQLGNYAAMNFWLGDEPQTWRRTSDLAKNLWLGNKPTWWQISNLVMNLKLGDESPTQWWISNSVMNL